MGLVEFKIVRNDLYLNKKHFFVIFKLIAFHYLCKRLLKTCGVVDLRSSDALRRETEYVNAQQ